MGIIEVKFQQQIKSGEIKSKIDKDHIGRQQTVFVEVDDNTEKKKIIRMSHNVQ